MRFFIPNSEDLDEQNKIYKAIRDFAKTTVGCNITNRRIYKITYRHNGKYHEAEVGKTCDTNNEPIIAILESNAYLVCTPSRGVISGMPIFVGNQEAWDVVDFEKEE
jgi:hypothetical protein